MERQQQEEGIEEEKKLSARRRRYGGAKETYGGGSYRHERKRRRRRSAGSGWGVGDSVTGTKRTHGRAKQTTSSMPGASLCYGTIGQMEGTSF